MIGVNDNSMYSKLLVFKFENYELEYPESINSIIKYSTNNGTFKELEPINTLGLNEYKKIYLLGLGLTEEFNPNRLFSALGSAIKSIKNSVDELDILDNFNEDFGYVIAQSIQLALYKFTGVKKKIEKTKLHNINIISKYVESINRGLIVANSVNYARQLVNMPSNIVTPKYLALQAEAISKEDGLDVRVLEKYSMEQLGMEGILYVAKGSIRNPRLIILQYFGDPGSKEVLSLIGKGVTFDSGGISLKPGKGMENMIADMAGAASVLGAMKAVAKLKPKKNIIAIIPAVENMLSGSAYKPGDVINTYSGKTVQVISTDAEGRLILCDAITYAREIGATKIIDIATLTGSCANFFGGINSGLLSNNDELADDIIKCGKRVGENFWRLPNNAEYLDQLKTDSADLRNMGTNSDAIVAGMFLSCFAEETAFAHLDIAGAAMLSKSTDVYDTGACGFPTRTLIEYIGL